MRSSSAVVPPGRGMFEGGWRSTWLLVAAAGIGFQVGHFVEHLAQLGYWAAHPSEAPWLTPWAAAGRDVLTFGGPPTTGVEVLHLLGNLIFLVGVVGLWMYARGRVGGSRPLRAALWLQGFHVGEHVLLTSTWLVTGSALGTSTLFGALDGAALSGYRVWWHFIVNLAATILALRAAWLLKRGPETEPIPAQA